MNARRERTLHGGGWLHGHPGGVLVLLLGVALLGGPAPARAQPAGTGTFTITVQPVAETFQGIFTFTGGPLATTVTTMPFTGTLDDANLQTSSVEFDLVAATVIPPRSVRAAGVAVCDNPACGAGTGTFVGGITNVIGTLLPPGPDYRLDGTVALTGNFLLLTGSGTFGINAFAPIPTTSGPLASISTGVRTFYNSLLEANDEFRVDVQFLNVAANCSTQVTGLSQVAGYPPALDRLGAFVNVTTDCTYGSALVCVHYDDEDTTGIDESTLLLVHRAAGTFTDITTMRDLANKRVCGMVSTFSPFAIGVIPTASTTTTTSTTSPSASTTSTTSETEPPSTATSSSTTMPSPTTTSTTLLQLIGAKKILIEVDTQKPTKNKLSFLAKGAVEAPGAANAPTVAGATLDVRDAGGQHATFALPVSGWKASGTKGYKYKDKKGVAGPCRSVVFKTGKQIKITCKGPGITLSPPLLDPVEVVLQMGAQTYCAAFGGSITKNESGSFAGKAAAAPAACGPGAAAAAALADIGESPAP
jgi:hypothetical protein